MAAEEPKIRIETREELIYMLAEAAAIEHNVMCCYLYGIWSMKRGERDGLSPEHAKIVASWKYAMSSVAVEEMTHLTLAGNLAAAIGDMEKADVCKNAVLCLLLDSRLDELTPVGAYVPRAQARRRPAHRRPEGVDRDAVQGWPVVQE